MSPRLLALAALLTLAAPWTAAADTVYYSQPGNPGIKSVSGTVLKESGGVVEVQTEGGGTVSIPRANVYQIVRDAKTEKSPTLDVSAFPAVRDALASGGHAESRSDIEPDLIPRPARPYQFGLKGGMNMANLSADPSELEDGGSLKSYALGAWCGVPLNRRLSLRAEALYSVKGDSETSGGYTATTHVSYIDVPVLARVRFLDGGTAQPSLFLGPSMAINVGANSTLEGQGTDLDVDVSDQVSQFELGMVVGGGVDFALGSNTYGVELRYARGLSNAAGETANGDAHNRVIAVMGSIGFK